MSYRQFSFRLPWQALKAFARPENESSSRSSEPTDEAETSASAADTVPYTWRLPIQSREIDPAQLPLEPAQALERSETMPPPKSHKEPSSRSRAKNQTQAAASKLPSPSKAISQSPVASNKSSSASANASPSHDTLKPSSPAGKASPTQDASKPSSPAAAAPRYRIASKPPSPSQTCSKNHIHSKPASQSRLKADSQPSSPSRSAFPPHASSIPWSPSHENSRQPSNKISRVQSPSHLSSKPTAQSTSQQHIESPAAIRELTTNRIASHPSNQSPQARPKNRESPLQTKAKQSPKSDLKPVDTRASKDQPETKEELTSKNTSYPHSNQDSYEIPIEIDETIKNAREPSLQSQVESKENKKIKSDKEIPAKATSASRSKLITSAEIPSPFEPQKKDSQQEGTIENSSKAFQKLNIKCPAEENPKSFTTLTGDDKEASVHLLSGEAKTESSIHIHRQYKSDPDQSPKTSTGIEENFNHETPKDSRTEEDPPVELYTNTNVQGINNSIMSNSSFSENNPGIKLIYVREPTKSVDKSQPLQSTRSKGQIYSESYREAYL